MPSLAESYFSRANELLARAWQTNAPVLARLAPILGDCVARGGVIHTFGSGHSELISREIIGRAGGLVCVTGIIDPTAGFIENLPGYGNRLAARYDRQYQLRSGEVLIAISNSGKNCSPIEVALYAKEKGLTVVALTSVATSRATPSEHPSGKKLTDVADQVLDNGGVPGDAIVEVLPATAGLPADLSAKAYPPPAAPEATKISAAAEASTKAGPTSTLIGCSVLNWLMLATIEWLKQHEHPLPILRSQNLPGAIEHNRGLAQKYQTRLSRQLA